MKSIEDNSRTGGPGAIEEEVKLIYEVKDICDELHLISRVVDSQNDVLTKFSNLFWPGTFEGAEKYRRQFMHDCGIEALVERVHRLKENAKRTLDAVSLYSSPQRQARKELRLD